MISIFQFLGIFPYFFLNYSKFKINLFDLNSIKYFFLFSRAHVAADVARVEKLYHVVTYETATCRTCVPVSTCARVHVCACTHVCASVCN